MKGLKKISWDYNNFFSEDIYKLEHKALFSSPNFLSLTNLFSEDNLLVPEYLQDIIIAKSGDNYSVLKNTCLHKNSKLLGCNSKRPNKKLITCPVHYWSYDLDGNLITAPLSNFTCKGSGMNIKSEITPSTLNNIILNSKDESFINDFINCEQIRDIIGLGDYKLVESTKESYEGNWKIYGIIFNDNTHIRFMHPHMTEFLNLETLGYTFGNGFNVQTCDYIKETKDSKDNKFYEYIKKRLECGLGMPSFGVKWVNIYPNFFFDIWDDYFSIDIVCPLSADKYEIYSYSFISDKMFQYKDVYQALLDAIEKVAGEDHEISDNLNEGFKANYNISDKYEEYVIPKYEITDIHYLEWIYSKGKDFYTGDFTIEDIFS